LRAITSSHFVWEGMATLIILELGSLLNPDFISGGTA